MGKKTVLNLRRQLTSRWLRQPARPRRCAQAQSGTSSDNPVHDPCRLAQLRLNPFLRNPGVSIGWHSFQKAQQSAMSRSASLTSFSGRAGNLFESSSPHGKFLKDNQPPTQLSGIFHARNPPKLRECSGTIRKEATSLACHWQGKAGALAGRAKGLAMKARSSFHREIERRRSIERPTTQQLVGHIVLFSRNVRHV